ncbi:2,3-dehydroadipyl-CoA hydratase [Pigmentiphaga humi]|uniref:2,3-dehydroadipyl-CoA hydratase n=1 Tax=Pigmentiphaga humi TaxID=2478468 RepID=A0A3P4B6T3_9BURK|nr:enoyl-CoA hydratase/isomerase family protein [Pigmentiphaga humi]VCU71631.1 2,3-dehydroadipyl-CoA hydratase [Pigmentiphaga humi]
MSEQLLLVERRGSAAIVTFNRPTKQNALSGAVLDAIDATLADLDRQEDVRGIVLTGNDKVFSTGGDLKEALAIETLPEIRAWLDAFWRANRRIESIGKPVVAAINGFCLTGGLELALCCDIRVSGEGATFGVTSSRIGTVAGAGATQRLARLVGPEWTKELLFSGDFIDAQTALRIRLVSEVVAPERVVERAVERIEAYARRAPLSVAYSKFAVNNGLQMDLESALHYERQITSTLFLSDDKREGMAAFLEKRAPNFTGR